MFLHAYFVKPALPLGTHVHTPWRMQCRCNARACAKRSSACWRHWFWQTAPVPKPLCPQCLNPVPNLFPQGPVYNEKEASAESVKCVKVRKPCFQILVYGPETLLSDPVHAASTLACILQSLRCHAC